MCNPRFVRSLLLIAIAYSSAVYCFTINNPHSTWSSMHRHRRAGTQMLQRAASSDTDTAVSGSGGDVVVGGVCSLSGQEVSRCLGRSIQVGQVSCLLNDADALSSLVDDDKRTLWADSVRPLLLTNTAEGNSQDSTPHFDAVVIATDVAPAPEAVKCFLSDAILCGTTTAVMLSRMAPSADVAAWRLAEDAAIAAAQGGSKSGVLRSLTILRTAELTGGPYYALNPDLLTASNAKFITTYHRDFAITASKDSKETVRQEDVGMSRPIAATVLETVLALRCPTDVPTVDSTDLVVSVLDMASVRSEALSEDYEERVIAALQKSAVKKERQRQEGAVQTPGDPPFSSVAALAPLAMPQQQVFKNPLLAPLAVSGPYWFLVILTIIGFGVSSSGLTWCNVQWAVDPSSPFYLPVTEKTCTCDALYNACRSIIL